MGEASASLEGCNSPTLEKGATAEKAPLLTVPPEVARTFLALVLASARCDRALAASSLSAVCACVKTLHILLLRGVLPLGAPCGGPSRGSASDVLQQVLLPFYFLTATFSGRGDPLLGQTGPWGSDVKVCVFVVQHFGRPVLPEVLMRFETSTVGGVWGSMWICLEL